MIKEVKDTSLYFIVNCDEEIKRFQEMLTFLDNVVSPGEFLEKIPEIRDSINRLDSRISVDKNHIQYLSSAYKTQIEQTRATLSKFHSQIEERMLMQNQLNTNVEFYDEENQLSKENYRGFEENPSMYSVLSIVKRILTDEPDYLDNLEKSLEEISNIYKWYIEVQSKMLNLKTMINDTAFTSLYASEYMSKEANDRLAEMRRFMRSASINLDNAKSKIRELFQMFNMQESDYVIYTKAIDKFNEIALESYFSIGVTSGVY